MRSGEGKKREKTHSIERTDSEDSNPVLILAHHGSANFRYNIMYMYIYLFIYSSKHGHIYQFVQVE
jgi:hypothetical protein